MRLLIFLMLAAASLPAQNLKFKIKQLPKDTSVGRVVLSSLTDSTMTYSDLLKIDNDSLYFNGSGVLTSAMDVGGGGGGYWTQIGSDIYYNTGNVGIGTSSPSEIFEINTDINGAAVMKFVNTNSVGNIASSRIQAVSDSNAIAQVSTFNTGFEFDVFGANAANRAFFLGFNGGANPNLVDVNFGSTANVPILFGTNNTEMMRITTSGNVGIGTTSPSSKLEVDGSATNASSFNEGSSALIDFSKSNIVYYSDNSSTVTLQNIKDGGAYTLISTANASTVVTFNPPSGFSVKYMGTVARTSGKHHLYSFIVVGTTVYVTMATEN